MGEKDPENEVSKAEENGSVMHEKSNCDVTEKRSSTNGEVKVLKDGTANKIGGDKSDGDKEGTEDMVEDQVATETKENTEESKVENKDNEKHKVDAVEEAGISSKNEVTDVKEEIKVKVVDKVDAENGKEKDAEKQEEKQSKKEETSAVKKADDNELEKEHDKMVEKADDKEVEKVKDEEKEKEDDKGAEKNEDKKGEIEDDDKEGEKETDKEEGKVEEKNLREADDKDEEMVNGEEEDKMEKEDEEMAECKEESTEEHEKDQEKEEEDEKELEMKEKETEEEEETEKNGALEKGSKQRGRGRVNSEKGKGRKKELMPKEPELKTPISDRPVRERKSVERLVTSIEKDNAKEFHIEKGCGTPLKDIPNVAIKLSRRKTDDTFKLLHTILFGRRGKAVEIKSNISRFSGFVWRGDEEKQKTKVREKFDKCNKEKLLEFCDLLDITIAKATTRKEDIVVKLIDFLVSPHPTTSVLLADKESSKGKKRARVVKRSSSTSGRASAKGKAKRQKRNEDSSKMKKDKATSDSEDESEEDGDKDEEDKNGVSEKSEDEMAEHSEREDKNDSADEFEDVGKENKNSKTSSKKKEPATKAKSKKVPNKSSVSSKRTPNKSSSNHPKMDENDDETSPKVFSRKKSNGKEIKEKDPTPTKSASKEKPGVRAAKGKGKNKEDKLKPSDDKLREAICEILKEVDFNTATFTDILKQLAKQFNTDLTPKKASIKLMIQEELTKLADEADDEDEGDIEKDENRSAPQVQA